MNRHRFRVYVPVLGLGLALLGGCQQDYFDDSLAPTMEQVDRIRNDANLTGQQKRDRLAELGIPPLTINALLRDETTSNQFGGNPRSSFDKVNEGRMREMTPDEVQLYANGAQQADTNITVSFTDAQAQAVVDFFDDNFIDTRAELETFLDDPANEVPGTIGEDPRAALSDVFVTLDPQELIPLLP